jgi:hypothetical protein
MPIFFLFLVIIRVVVISPEIKRAISSFTPRENAAEVPGTDHNIGKIRM